MTNTPTISVLRSPAWPVLSRRLDAAVAKDPSLRAARDVVTRPVALLELMAADAIGALGDDVLRAERLRALLHLAWPYAAVVQEAKSSEDPLTKYEPGVLDFGPLLLVALAAIRVAPEGSARLFLAAVEGLALASAAAEVFGRLDPLEPDSDALAVILRTLELLSAVGEEMDRSLLKPFSADPVERARWNVLRDLFEKRDPLKREQTDNSGWDGAYSDEIEEIIEYETKRDQLTVRGTFRRFGAVEALPAGVELIFAAANQPPLIAELLKWKKLSKGKSDLLVRIPEDAQPGWIGFTDAKKIEDSNTKHRTVIITELKKLAGDHPGLRYSHVPHDALPLFGDIAVPPRTGSNRWVGNDPRVVDASLTPSFVEKGGTLTLTWQTSGSTGVLVRDHTTKEELFRGPPTGERSIPTTGRSGELVLEVIAIRVRGDKTFEGTAVEVSATIGTKSEIAELQILQGGRPPPFYKGGPLEVTLILRPATSKAIGALAIELPSGTQTTLEAKGAENGRIVFEIPADSVENGMTITATIAETPSSGTTGTKSEGPLSVFEPREQAIILIQPRNGTDGVRPEPLRTESSTIMRTHTARSGMSGTIRTLPWIDDLLAVLPEPLAGQDDPRIPRLLERVSRRAMLTPGFERAVWLVVVPNRHDSKGFFVSASAEAARVVAVADAAGVPKLLEKLAEERAEDSKSQAGREKTDRLRLIGELTEDAIEIHSALVEHRELGTRGTFDTGIVAYALDEHDKTLLTSPVKSIVKPTRPMHLALLMAVTDDVRAVELRQAGEVLARIDHTRGTLELQTAILNDHGTGRPSTLTWSYHHTQRARPQVSLAIGDEELITPAIAIDADDTVTDVPLTRFGSASSIVLIGNDGWNVDKKRIDASVTNTEPVIARRLRDGVYFADVPDGWSVHWSLEGDDRGDQRVLHLRPKDSGLLRLAARPSEGSTIFDFRRVPPGEI